MRVATILGVASPHLRNLRTHGQRIVAAASAFRPATGVPLATQRCLVVRPRAATCLAMLLTCILRITHGTRLSSTSCGPLRLPQRPMRRFFGIPIPIITSTSRGTDENQYEIDVAVPHFAWCMDRINERRTRARCPSCLAKDYNPSQPAPARRQAAPWESERAG